MATVAIVTSTSFGNINDQCFRKGLASVGALPTILPPFQADGNYDETFLRSKIRAAVNNNPAPNLIVTAGGIAMAVAAQKELTQANDPKYIYLTGDDPGNPTAATAGGVNMDNPGGDKARKDAITHGQPPFNVDPGKIYLIVNYNSLMTGKDANNWPPAKVAKFFDHTANPPDPINPINVFNTEFTNLKNRTPKPEGLVISADPYFRLWRTAFTAALGGRLPVPVCYPFQDFLDAINNQGGKPNINNSLALDKPKLNNGTNYNDPDTAYFWLGKQAGTFLSTNANVGVAKWDWQHLRWQAPSQHK